MKKIAVVLAVLLCAGCSMNQEDIKEGKAQSKPDENGNYTVVKVKYSKSKDKVVDLNIDEFKDGASIKDLGRDYGMKSVSAVNREWDEQIHYLETFIKDYSVEDLKMNEYGVSQNPDVVSGCSIYIGHMIPLVEEAIADAKK